MTDHEGSNWDEYKLPCPECGGSDPVGKNKDGSAHCFSCDTHFHDYDKACESQGLERTTTPTVSKIKDHRNK